MNSRQSIGHDAPSVTALTDTPIWQLPTFPSAPQYWRATPTDILPCLGNPVSSITHAAGAIPSHMRRANARRTATQSHGDWLTNCCKHCSSPSSSRAAIGSMLLRRPSSINPRRYTEPQRR
jgi:hypothetical protein